MRKSHFSVASDIHGNCTTVSPDFEQEQSGIDSTRAQSYKGWCLNHKNDRIEIATLYRYSTKKGIYRIQSPLDRLAGNNDTNKNHSKDIKK